MARRCPLTGKSVLAGNKVSHSNRKTRRRFLPNMQNVSLLSNALGGAVRLRISVNTLRTVEAKGGIDNFILNTPNHKLSEEALKIKRQLRKALLKKQA